MTKAVACVSGGLDSVLAVALMQRLGIEVTALHIAHLWHPQPFDPAATPAELRPIEARGARIVVVDGSAADLEMVRHPRFGFGKRMNPCLDCRIWTLGQAKRLMEAEGAAFVFTGEVLGQRPMSQHRQALDRVARESGLEDRLLRPLSAQRLAPTRPERDGVVDRARLAGISGRSRHPQMALAAELGITEYANPAGGCLLTDPIFAHRLCEHVSHGPVSAADVELLKVGRHFRLDERVRLVIGRHEADNARIASLLGPSDVRLEATDMPGPTSLLRGRLGEEPRRAAARMTLRYCKTESGKTYRVTATPSGEASMTITATPADEAEIERQRIAPESTT